SSSCPVTSSPSHRRRFWTRRLTVRSSADSGRIERSRARQGREGRVMLPLDGVRVVALEQAVAGPLCTRHLADLGADVVKIERPDGGDFARRYDAFVKGESAHFVWLNRGKRSVVLDVKQPADRA